MGGTGKESKKSKAWRAIKEVFERSLVEPTDKNLKEKYGSRQSVVSNEFRSVLEAHQVYVKVISASGLLALDTNNLSDPYTIVALGKRSFSTRVIRKTLDPVWDETFVFESSTIVDALEDGSGYVHLRLFDWDQFSKDDFLGHAVLPLTHLENLFMEDAESLEKRRLIHLPLTGMRKGVEEEHGQVQICVWISPVVGYGLYFAPQLGLLGAPRHLHGNSGCVMEEPYIVSMCMGILEIHGMDDPFKFRGKVLNKSFSNVSPNDDKFGDQMSEFQTQLREKQMLDLFGLTDDDFDGGLTPKNGDNVMDSDELNVGSFAYCRVTMGSTTKTTHLVRQQGSRIPINDLIPFLSHVPMPNYEIQIMVYRTHKSKERGRATHVAAVSMYDILPQDAGNPSADLKSISKVVQISLKPISSKYEEAKMLVRVTLADMDFRRRIAQQPIILKNSMDLSMRGMIADPRNMILPHSKGFHLNEDDIYQLARKDDERYQEYIQHRQKWEEVQGRVTGFLKGFAERQMEKAYKLVGMSDDGSKNVFNDALQNSLEQSYNVPKDPDAGKLYVPPVRGLLRLRLFTLTSHLLKTSNPHVLCVVKFENSWFRTEDLHANDSGTIDLGDISLVLPIMSPGSLLSICCMTKSRKNDSKEVSRGSFTVLGKLRFRISSCAVNEPVRVTLPFLSQRSDGGNIVGNVSMEISQNFSSKKEMLAGYFAPEYPQENYVYRTVPLMKSLEQERRDLLEDWMLSCNPPFPKEAVHAIENIDATVFSLSRLKSNLRRIKIAIKTIGELKVFYNLLTSWRYPWLTRLAMCFAFFTAYHPLPVLVCVCFALAYLCYTSRPDDVGNPKEMEQDTVAISEIDTTEEEELFTGIKLNVESSNPVAKLKKKLESVTGILLMVQNYMDSVASFLERWIALLSWKDPVATTAVVCVLAGFGTLVMIVGIRFIIGALLCFLLRPPRMRSPWTPGPISLFLKLPTRGERLA